MKNIIFKTGAFGTGVLALATVLTGCAAGVGTGSELASTVNEDLTVTVEVDGMIAKLGQGTMKAHNLVDPEDVIDENLEDVDAALGEAMEIKLWNDAPASAISDFAATYFSEMEGGFYLGAVVSDVNGCIVTAKLPMTLSAEQTQVTLGGPVITNSCDMLIENKFAEIESGLADFWNSNPIVLNIVMDEETRTITLSKPEGDRLMSETLPMIEAESEDDGVLEEFSIVIHVQEINSATIIPIVSDFTTFEFEEDKNAEQVDLEG